MKKALAILLSLILMFSCTAVSLAADESAAEPDYSTYVNIFFIVDGAVAGTVRALPGEMTAQDVVDTIGTPSKEATDTVRYIFEGWYASDESGNVIDGAEKQLSATFKIPEAAGNYYYSAVFYEENIKETTTFWAFIQTIFARINLIFEYFAKVFEGIIDFEN